MSAHKKVCVVLKNFDIKHYKTMNGVFVMKNLLKLQFFSTQQDYVKGVL